MIFLKKFLILPLLFCIICGCSQKRQVKPILNNIAFTALADYNSDKYNVDATITDGALNLIVNEPEKIKGFVLQIDKNNVKAEYKGISYDSDIDSLPQAAIARLLFNIVDDISDKNLICSNENCEIIGEVDDIQYNFIFSPAGLPLSLNIEDINLKIEFSNVTLK